MKTKLLFKEAPAYGELEMVAYRNGLEAVALTKKDNPYPKDSPFHAAWEKGRQDRNDEEMSIW